MRSAKREMRSLLWSFLLPQNVVGGVRHKGPWECHLTIALSKGDSRPTRTGPTSWNQRTVLSRVGRKNGVVHSGKNTALGEVLSPKGRDFVCQFEFASLPPPVLPQGNPDQLRWTLSRRRERCQDDSPS